MIFGYIMMTLLLYMPKNFAGSGMSCLNKLSAEEASHEAAIARNYVGIEHLLAPHLDLTVQQAEQYKQAGFNRFTGRDGYQLLETALTSSYHETGLIALYMHNGADPNYIVHDEFGWSNETLRDRERPRQKTIMNELWWIAEHSLHLQVNLQPAYRPEFIAKACALVQAGASLSGSRYDSDSGEYGVELEPIAYRMNVPWQLKRFMFTRCFFSSPKLLTDKVKLLLDLRSALMKTWDQKVISHKDAHKKKISDHLAIVFDSGKQPIRDIIAEYARNDLLYQELENQIYYDCDDKGVQGRLLPAPEGNYKPCVHNHSYSYQRPSKPCTGPCKEVFQAFGMQPPDSERYKKLKNSRFADRDGFAWIDLARGNERIAYVCYGQEKRTSFVRRFNLEEQQ